MHSFPGFEADATPENPHGDMRAALLRALTELYVQKPSHSRQEERHYVELASRLLDNADNAMRTWMAARLSTYGAAPEAIVRRLTDDVPQVTAPVLREVAQVMRGEAAGTAAQPSARAQVQASAQTAPATALPWAVELNESFFAASTAERRLILLNLAYRLSTPPTSIASARNDEVNRQLEAAALAHNRDAFIRTLERSLEISAALAYRIVHDPLGEPLVVAAKALGMNPDVLQRILLFINPIIGRSVPRIYVLATLYDEVEAQAALELVAIWRATDPPRTGTVARDARRDDRRGGRQVAARKAPASGYGAEGNVAGRVSGGEE